MNIIKFSIFAILYSAAINLSAQVAINTDGTTANPTAMLDVSSTTAGVLVPRMTAQERDAIVAPAVGLLVFVTADNSFYFFSGTAWVRINSLTADDPTQPIPIKFQGEILYVHPTDNSTGSIWGTIANNSNANSLTDGEANTTTLASLGGNTAAVICYNLDAYGYDDWYLPSKYELDAIYKQSYLMQNLEQIANYKYWSSTESDLDQAWTQRLDYGGPDPDMKDSNTVRVRCVRKD